LRSSWSGITTLSRLTTQSAGHSPCTASCIQFPKLQIPCAISNHATY
jgi:hypothetical protein